MEPKELLKSQSLRKIGTKMSLAHNYADIIFNEIIYSPLNSKEPWEVRSLLLSEEMLRVVDPQVTSLPEDGT